MKNQEYLKYKSEHSDSLGAPVKSEESKSPPAKTLQLCSKCFSSIGPGKSQICSKNSLHNNLVNIANNNDIKSRERVTSSLLKISASEQGVTTRGGDVNIESG